MEVLLPFRPPLAAAALARALRAHAVPGLERHPEGGPHARVVPAPGGPAVATVHLDGADGAMRTRLGLADPADLAPVTAALRRLLDLDAHPGPIDRALARDPRLAPLVAARPGLRVLGTTDGFETAVLTVLGQQVSLAAARTFGGRLVAAFGRPAGAGLTGFPRPEALVAAGPERLRAATGVTGARARTVHALAEAAACGLDLGPRADRATTRARLLALPGVGPWTVDCLAVRILGDRDAFPAGDLVLRRALGVRDPRNAAALGERWRPWRAYALFHLWTAEAFT